MNTLQILLSKIKALFGQQSDDQAFSEEVQAHLAMLEETFLRQGMSPRDAAAAARKQFGNTTILEQQHRELRTTMFFTRVWRDVRFGARQLWKTPVFTIVSILTIALGIGANTAVFSVMHAVLLKMLPVSDASQVVYLKLNDRPAGTSNTGDDATSFSYSAFDAIRQRKTGFVQVMAYVPMSFSGKVAVRVSGAPEEATGDMVSGNYFSGLGVGMQSGRGFLPQDEAQHTQVAVISSTFWTRRFARDSSIVGKTIYIKAVPFVIVGVASPGFEGTEGGASLDLWIPLQNRPEFNAWGASPYQGSTYLQLPAWWCIRVMARLAPGISHAQALAQAQTVFQHAAYIGIAQPHAGDKPPQMAFGDARQFNSEDADFAKSLKTLMAMVLLVLAIAVSNVVMLLLARNANRKREFSIRLALGASRKEVARQLLTESILLVLLGGAAAWIFAVVATRALGVWAQIDANVQPDTTVLWFTSILLLLAALIFGLAPLRSAMASKPEMVLKSSSAVSQADAQKVRAGNAVIVMQIAMCLVLLVGAGLLIGTLRNLLNTPLGMQTQGLLVFGVHPREAATPQASVAFYQGLQQQLAALPGVKAVTLAENRPGSGWSNNNDSFLVDGHKPSEADTQFRANNVGSNYFSTMGIPILAGRDFSDGDSPTAPGVVIVNETFAHKFIHSPNAIGHTIQGDSGPPFRIIAVVKDHKYTGITEEARPMMWMDFAQSGRSEGEMNIEMRTQGDPLAMLPAARKLVQQLDPDMPLLQPMTQTAQFARSISQQVLFARLAGFFGALAVILIATGLYGTLAYRVSRRNAEIGVRMALGAQRGQVVWMVLRSSLLLTAAGVVVGIPLAALVARALASSLYGMALLDPAAFAVAIVGVAIVALAASALPARRAASIDPVGALRSN